MCRQLGSVTGNDDLAAMLSDLEPGVARLSLSVSAMDGHRRFVTGCDLF